MRFQLSLTSAWSEVTEFKRLVVVTPTYFPQQVAFRRVGHAVAAAHRARENQLVGASLANPPAVILDSVHHSGPCACGRLKGQPTSHHATLKFTAGESDSQPPSHRGKVDSPHHLESQRALLEFPGEIVGKGRGMELMATNERPDSTLTGFYGVPIPLTFLFIKR